MKTTITSASVKIMLSYDYSHFEVSMSLEDKDGILKSEIDDARKQCQKLADKAVGQYKTAKEMAAKRTDSKYRISNFEASCQQIIKKPEGERTINEVAQLKQYQDENWREQFEYPYDYDDDDNYPF